MEGVAIVAARGVGGKLVFGATGGRTGVDVCICVEPIGDGEDDCVVLCHINKLMVIAISITRFNIFIFNFIFIFICLFCF